MEISEKSVLKHAGVSFLASVFLGVLFIYLFCWKPVGISYPIFSLFYIILSLVPLFIIEKKDAFKKISKGIIILPLVYLFSSAFLYRLNIAGVVWGLLIITITQIFVITGVFKKEIYSNLNIIGLILLPILFSVSWIGDAISFLKRFFGLIKHLLTSKNNVTKNFAKIAIGLIISLPLFILFAALFSMADQIFAKEFIKIFQSIFGNIFASWDKFGEFFAKVVVGGIVSVYTMVYFFSLWNKDSLLDKMLSKRLMSNLAEIKKSFSPLTISTILVVINSIFLFFVVVQFKYLFGGEEKVLTYDNGLSYAEYARRGFGELMLISVLTFFIISIISLKTKATTLIGKIIYKGNLFVLIGSVFVVIASAFTRMMLYENVYGFTSSRLLVNVCIVLLGIMYLLLVISMIVKNQWRFLNISTAVMVIFSLLCIPLIPYDLVAVKLNYTRYLKEDKIDVKYIAKQSDEVIPVLVGMRDDVNVSSEVRRFIDMDLEKRYHDESTKRDRWQSFNLLYWFGRDKLGNDYEASNSKYMDEMVISLEQFINDYRDELIAGNYEEAYNKFWMSNSLKNEDFEKLKNVRVRKYEIYNYNDYEDSTNITSLKKDLEWYLYPSYDYNYDTLSVSMELEYDLMTPGCSWDDSYGYCMTRLERTDFLYIILENGNWKVKRSSQMPIGNFVDGDMETGRVFTDSNIYYEDNLDVLFDTSY